MSLYAKVSSFLFIINVKQNLLHKGPILNETTKQNFMSNFKYMSNFSLEMVDKTILMNNY